MIAGVSLFGYVVVKERIPQHAAEFFLDFTDNPPIIFMLAINLMLLVLGAFIETLALLLLVVPILLPVAISLGIDLSILAWLWS